MSDKKPEVFEFPCEIGLKVMGQANDEFEQAALAIIRKHSNDWREDSIQTRDSKNGNYRSLTVTINIEHKDMMEALYLELNSHELILMTL